jgi:hypothetical protein
MSKAKRYETVALLEPIDGFHKGEKGAVVEVYTAPYEAYDIEIVTDEGETKGLIEGVHPEQIEVIGSLLNKPQFAAIDLEADGRRAKILFSDGTEVTVSAEELYEHTA